MPLTMLLVAAPVGAALLSAAMMGAWWLQKRTGHTGWIDVTWSFSLGAVAVLAALLPSGPDATLSVRQVCVAGLVGAWSVRLGWHILLRTRAVGDDPRYRHLIRTWGDDADRRLFWNLQIQAGVSLLLCLAVMLAAHTPNPDLRPQDILGGLLLLAGIVGEGAADYQLRQSRQRLGPGTLCDTGLWRLSRHPNYFFEWICWCAYPVIAVDFAGANPFGWLALLAPLCMYWLLTSVSGIPPLEDHMIRTRGDAYRRYQARTRAFFPLPK